MNGKRRGILLDYIILYSKYSCSAIFNLKAERLGGASRGWTRRLEGRLELAYGRLAPGSEVEIGGYTIKLIRGKRRNILKYERIREGEVVKQASIYYNQPVLVIPARPMILPASGLSSCLYVEFPEEMYLPPLAVVNINLRITTDIAVIVIVEGKYQILDVMDPGIPPKLAFYGESSRGMLCRYTKAEIDEGMEKPGTAVMRVSIVNGTEAPVKVVRIVVPLQRMRMYFEPGSWHARTSDVIMNIRGDIAEIELEEPSSPTEKKLMLSPLSFMGRELPIINLSSSFIMEWGF